MLSRCARRICYKTGVSKFCGKDIKRLVGERVRELRLARGITSQEKLGELASDLHRTFIGRVERGETNISIENLQAITRALEVSLADFFKPFDDGRGERASRP
jgi:transcriptional regulator with XRE-family HTH domain